MGGKSAQEKEAERQNTQLRDFVNALNQGQYNVANRFSNYQNPFEYKDISKNISDIYSGYKDIINRDTEEAISNQQRGASQSLASRGITGGSILTDTSSRIANEMNKGKVNALTNLGIGESEATSNLMNLFNNLGFRQTQAAQNVDLQNMGNILSSLVGAYGGQRNLLGAYDSGTWLDDVFSGLGLATSIAGIPFTGGTSLLGSLIGGGGSSMANMAKPG